MNRRHFLGVLPAIPLLALISAPEKPKAWAEMTEAEQRALTDLMRSCWDSAGRRFIA